MRKLRYQLVDVFTNERFGGNQLAVFTNGRGLETELMQQIAKELNLAETTFVLPPDDTANHWKVRIFTPAAEMPMAGHPTVGTSYVLAREHLVNITPEQPGIRLEEKVGVIPVTFDFDDGGHLQISMQQPNPTFGEEFSDRAVVAEMLSISVDDLAEHPIQMVTCGVPFLLVPIRTLGAIKQVKLRLDMWEQHLKNSAAPQVFAFTLETEQADSTVHSRMFAPALGIPEDPATGAASGPLGSYLVKYGLVTGNPAHIISEQGFEIGRKSFIHIEIRQENGEINFVSVGGQCVAIGEGVIEI